MALFVHLTSESLLKRIRRSGIARVRFLWTGERGIFAMPVTPNFYLSHQWLRELRLRGLETIAGVYFRLRDDEPVWIGRYNKEHRSISAAQAAPMLLADRSPEGIQVIIPRKIAAREIHKIRRLPQVVGWRYLPGSHGCRPCGCDMCQRGRFGARKIRERWEKG